MFEGQGRGLIYVYFISHQVQHSNAVITVKLKDRLKHKVTMTIHEKTMLLKWLLRPQVKPSNLYSFRAAASAFFAW